MTDILPMIAWTILWSSTFAYRVQPNFIVKELSSEVVESSRQIFWILSLPDVISCIRLGENWLIYTFLMSP